MAKGHDKEPAKKKKNYNKLEVPQVCEICGKTFTNQVQYIQILTQE